MRRDQNLLAKAFLVDCAFFLRINKKSSDYWIWNNATYSTASWIFSFEAFMLSLVGTAVGRRTPSAVQWILDNRLPVSIAGVVIGWATLYSVERLLDRYKYDVSSARKYLNRTGIILWLSKLASSLGAILLCGYLWWDYFQNR